MIVIRSSSGVETMIQAQDVAVSDTLGSFQTLSFSFVAIPDNEVAAASINPFTIVTLPENQQQYRVLTSTYEKLGQYLQYQVTCIHIGKDLHNNYVEKTVTGTQTLDDCLKMIIPSDFSYSIENTFKNYYFSETFGKGYADDLLTQLASDFGFEWYFDNKVLHVRTKIGDDNSFLFVDNLNCSKINVQENYENVQTYIKGFANPKKDEEGNVPSDDDSKIYQTTAEYKSPYIDGASFPVVQAETYYSDDNLTYDGLVKKLKEQISDAPEVQYTIDYLNFKKFSQINNKIAIGNSGYLRDRFGVDVYVRISAYTQYPQDSNQQDTITFGNKILDPNVWAQRNAKAKVVSDKKATQLAQSTNVYYSTSDPTSYRKVKTGDVWFQI